MHGLILTLWMIMAMREHDAAGRQRRRFSACRLLDTSLLCGKRGYFSGFTGFWQTPRSSVRDILPSTQLSFSSQAVKRKEFFKVMKVIFLLKTIKTKINSMYHLVLESEGSDFSYLGLYLDLFQLYLSRVFMRFNPISALTLKSVWLRTGICKLRLSELCLSSQDQTPVLATTGNSS